MSNYHDIPIHIPPQQNRPSKRPFSSTLRGSFSARLSKLLCTILLGLILILGILAFILWISLRPHRPRLHVEQFSVPGLSEKNGSENVEISFVVTIRNPNQNIGIYFDSTDVWVYNRGRRIGRTPVLFPFYEPPKNTTWIHGNLTAPTLSVNGGNGWKELMADRVTRMIAFRLELRSTIRFKVATWETRHHRMNANCDVAVGQDGLILPSSKDKRCLLYFR